MSTTTTTRTDHPTERLSLAMELGNGRWHLGFTTGFGQATRQRSVAARDRRSLLREIGEAKKRFGLPAQAHVASCYEAGRDGFWLHRFLVSEGVENHVIDSSSIEVNRRRRRAKTDRLPPHREATNLPPNHWSQDVSSARTKGLDGRPYIEGGGRSSLNWDAVGAIAELVGATGVIASLFYLGTQIRQNTRSVRVSNYHALVTNLANLASDIGRDASASDLFVQGQSDLQALSPTEQRQFGSLLMSVFRNYENIYYQFSQNMIDEVVWAGWKTRIIRYFWQPGVQAWWPTWRDDCHPDFREFLESSSLPSGPAVPLYLGDATDPAA